MYFEQTADNNLSTLFEGLLSFHTSALAKAALRVTAHSVAKTAGATLLTYAATTCLSNPDTCQALTDLALGPTSKLIGTAAAVAIGHLHAKMTDVGSSPLWDGLKHWRETNAPARPPALMTEQAARDFQAQEAARHESEERLFITDLCSWHLKEKGHPPEGAPIDLTVMTKRIESLEPPPHPIIGSILDNGQPKASELGEAAKMTSYWIPLKAAADKVAPEWLDPAIDKASGLVAKLWTKLAGRKVTEMSEVTAEFGIESVTGDDLISATTNESVTQAAGKAVDKATDEEGRKQPVDLDDFDYEEYMYPDAYRDDPPEEELEPYPVQEGVHYGWPDDLFDHLKPKNVVDEAISLLVEKGPTFARDFLPSMPQETVEFVYEAISARKPEPGTDLALISDIAKALISDGPSRQL